MCRILLGVKVLALPDISGHVAEHGGEVVVAAAAGCATESLTFGLQRGRGAAPKRGAVIFDQATT